MFDGQINSLVEFGWHLVFVFWWAGIVFLGIAILRYRKPGISLSELSKSRHWFGSMRSSISFVFLMEKPGLLLMRIGYSLATLSIVAGLATVVLIGIERL